MLTKTRWLVALLVAGGGGTAGLLLASTGRSSAEPAATLLKYPYKDAVYNTVELTAHGVQSGSEEAVVGKMYSSNTVVGSFIMSCTYVQAYERSCTGSAWIGSAVNQISFAGYTNSTWLKNVLPVTGGSGKYMGMRGQL